MTTSRPISKLGPVEAIKGHPVVRPAYDPEWDEYVLTVNGRRLQNWTELVREFGEKAYQMLMTAGAQISSNCYQYV